MKICHVNLASGFSGGERQTLQLIKQQLTEGTELIAVVNPKSPLVVELQTLPIELHFAKHYLYSHSRKITAGCDVIHVHEGRGIYWALLQNALTGLPYIITRRIDNLFKNRWLSNLAYRKSAALVGLSSEIVCNLRSQFPNNRCYKIPSSPVSYDVNCDQIHSIKNQYHGKFIVIHAANMLKHKGFNLSVEAARYLQSSHPDIHFCLLGDGPEREALETQAAVLSNVSFVGKIRNMGDWFSSADLLIHPSYSEGLGSVILEALGFYLPVIGANVGGIPDIIEPGVSGLLCEKGNAKDLAEKIVHIYESEMLRARLRAGAEKKLPTFDIAHTSAQYSQVYSEIGL